MSYPNTRRARVRTFIGEFIAQHGYAPSVREIGRAVGLKSSSAAYYHLQALEAAGEVRRERYISRAITICKPRGQKKPSSTNKTTHP
jgi:repressor LexA